MKRMVVSLMAVAVMFVFAANANAGLLRHRCCEAKACAPAACEPVKACAPAAVAPAACTPAAPAACTGTCCVKHILLRRCRCKVCEPKACEPVKVCEPVKACEVKCKESVIMRATELCEIADEIKSLNDKLNPLGFEIVLQQVSKNGHAVPQIDKRGIGKYWDAINEIAAKKNITKAQAKEIYKKSHEKADGKVKEKVSEGMTKYWNLVRSICDEKKISMSEARKFVADSKDQKQEAVVQPQ